jgi:hypothetical protein
VASRLHGRSWRSGLELRLQPSEIHAAFGPLARQAASSEKIGFEAAGTVGAIGVDMEGFAIGRLCCCGAYAVSFEQAAAIWLSSGTEWAGMLTTADLPPAKRF